MKIVKIESKSEQAILYIEKVYISKQHNIWYVVHSFFIDICSFEFLGDNIIESANTQLNTSKINIWRNICKSIVICIALLCYIVFFYPYYITNKLLFLSLR